MWGQSKISCYCFYFWCESREFGGRGSSRFHCVTPVVETSSGRISHLEFRQTSTMELLCSNSQLAEQFDCFRKKASSQTSDQIPNTDPPKRCFKFRTGGGGLQVHGIGSRRLMYKEVVEVGSNYKNSYFW